MKPNVLLLAPPDAVVRSWSHADAPLERWRGAMIEQAFLEIVRTLDEPSRLGDILDPWSALLAPLLAVTLPADNPDSTRKVARTRERHADDFDSMPKIRSSQSATMT